MVGPHNRDWERLKRDAHEINIGWPWATVENRVRHSTAPHNYIIAGRLRTTIGETGGEIDGLPVSVASDGMGLLSGLGCGAGQPCMQGVECLQGTSCTHTSSGDYTSGLPTGVGSISGALPATSAWDIYCHGIPSASEERQATSLGDDLKTTVYISPLEGHQHRPGRAQLLLKGLYGPEKARRAWTETIANVGEYVRHGKGLKIITTHIDDELAASAPREASAELGKEIHGGFERVNGKPPKFNGIDNSIDHGASTIRIGQERMIQDICSHFGTPDGKPLPLPLRVAERLTSAEDLLGSAVYPYSSSVGALLGTSTSTRPDAVGALTGCMEDPMQQYARQRAQLEEVELDDVPTEEMVALAQDATSCQGQGRRASMESAQEFS